MVSNDNSEVVKGDFLFPRTYSNFMPVSGFGIDDEMTTLLKSAANRLVSNKDNSEVINSIIRETLHKLLGKFVSSASIPSKLSINKKRWVNVDFKVEEK